MSSGRVAALAGVGDLSFWALEEQLEEEDFAKEARIQEELEEARRRLLAELKNREEAAEESEEEEEQ